MRHCSPIILLAGGSSVLDYDLTGLSARGDVIGVNDAFLNYDECFMGITMDRVWMEARVDAVLASGKPFYVRHAAVKYLVDKINDADNISLYDCEETHELSSDPEKINGTSSGMCALNLALQLNPPVIYLIGYDMGGPRWYQYDFKNWEPKGNKFDKWIAQFNEIAKKTKTRIVNVNHMSALKCFPTVTYKDFMNDTETR